LVSMRFLTPCACNNAMCAATRGGEPTRASLASGFGVGA
jgi:hypothetical protein